MVVSSLMVFHMIVSVLLIVVVLLQFGKGAEAGLMSGGGEVFTGSQRGNILSKITIVLSVIFMSNSVFLAKLQSSSSSKSILDDEAPVSRPLNSDAVNQTAPTEATEAKPAEEKKEEAK